MIRLLILGLVFLGACTPIAATKKQAAVCDALLSRMITRTDSVIVLTQIDIPGPNREAISNDCQAIYERLKLEKAP